MLGKVKTRLAKSIGDQKALKVYKDLLVKCRNECLKLKVNRHLFYSEQIEDDEWDVKEFLKHVQAEGDLGMKMSSAFKNIFQKPGKVVVIGSDCFDLNFSMIEEAFAKLDSKDVVIGPANDGGYYLLGTNKYYPQLFENIAWSTELVLEQTIQKAKFQNLSVSLLKELIDLDTLEDLELSGYELKE